MYVNGLAKRLTWFSPGDGGPVMGWNVLAPNALPVATHAKAVRETILSGWGQHSIDDTAQLARFLFLALAIARDQHLTLVEALEVLEPDSPVRAAVLPTIRDLNRPGFPGGPIVWENGFYGKTKQILTRGSRAFCPPGSRADGQAQFSVGGDSIGSLQDRLHGRDAPQVGAAG
jgi:hypothetical protein